MYKYEEPTDSEQQTLRPVPLQPRGLLWGILAGLTMAAVILSAAVRGRQRGHCKWAPLPLIMEDLAGQHPSCGVTE